MCTTWIFDFGRMAASCNQIFSDRPPSTASIWPVT